MAWDAGQLDRIFESTDGRCHLCWRDLNRARYGIEWEVDHSNPRASGGTDRAPNLKPACMPCNRRKQARSNEAVRREYGHSRAPRSAHARRERATAGGLLGALLGALGGPAGVILGAIAGVAVGSYDDDRPTWNL